MESSSGSNNLYRQLSKAIFLAAGLVILLWLLSKIVSAIILLLFALVLAIIINAPVTWLEKKGIKRGWASLIVFVAILFVLIPLGWLVVPKIITQIQNLVANLPDYANQASDNISALLNDYSKMSDNIKKDDFDLTSWLPSVRQALTRIGTFSLSMLSGLVLFIIFTSMVVYTVTSPRPLVEIYYSWFKSEKRGKARKALQDTSVMLVGWFRANLIGGSIEAFCTGVFLSFMGVPGAWVWGALALFAELVPKIGFYIMSIPPVLVAMSVGTTTALWVAIFFLALNEIMGNFVMPKLRSSTMNIHPVSTLFMLIAMGSAFGLGGALLATPMAAIIKGFYYTFYANNQENKAALEKEIDDVIYISGKKKEKENS